jgi:chemotaxis protein methyltransferase CheR
MSEAVFKTSVTKEFMPLIEKVSALVHKISGNRLGDKQSFMVETRLRKRMIELSLKAPSDYIAYLEQNFQKESGVLVGLLTTHHTFFFREFIHFELLKKMLPEFAAIANKRADKTITIWSAACSRGQEVYSLAMFLDYYLPLIDPSIKFSILGTDIDEESVKIAANGVYHQNEIKEVPMNFLANHWAKGTGDIAMYAKVKSSLREKVNFKSGNLLNLSQVVSNQKFDIIFCRNVFIYFEQHQIEKICEDFVKAMHQHSLFFSGISESLTGFKVDFNSVGPSTYRAKSYNAQTIAPTAFRPSGSTQTPSVAPTPATFFTPDVIKVMCVDDSPSIITLLKKVLGKEQGFEIVATAINGIDAMEKLKTVKPDVITLDIHMPEMDGVTYLQKNFNPSHPPVVMISSASREDSDVAMKALKSGASDYVEKPSLQNLEEKGEEIRTKIKTVVSDKQFRKEVIISTLDKEMSHPISIDDPKNKMRVFTASISDFKRIKKFFEQCVGQQPPTIIFFEGQGEILEALAKDFSREIKFILHYMPDDKMEIKPGEVYFIDMKKWFKPMAQKYSHFKTSVMCFGMVSKFCSENVLEWKNAQLLLEDLGEKENQKGALKDVATDIVPMTSFPYMSTNFLAKK